MRAFELYYKHFLSQVPVDERASLVSAFEFVDINNVAEYFYITEKEEWNFGTDFFCVAPPWPMAWMEFQMPKAQLISQGMPPVQMHFGAAILGFEIPPEYRQVALQEDFLSRYAYHSMSLVGAHTNLLVEPGWASKAQKAVDAGLSTRWGLLIPVYVAGNNKIAPVFTASLYLDENGAILVDLIRFIIHESTPTNLVDTRDMSPALPFLYALQFLHCKNVETADAPSPRAIRRRLKKMGAPDIIFKELIVHAMGAKRPSSQDPDYVPSGVNRLHICRGHFKDYRQGPGLFGRYKGLYWWAQHARGNVSKGAVIKDYRLEESED